jgi:hypothetical protein
LSSARCALRNSIILGRPFTGDLPSGVVIAAHSLIQLPDPLEVWPGEANLNAAPLFAGPDDFRLLPGSPGIDAAPLDPAVPDDIDGRPRPCDGGTLVDLGAHETGCGAFQRGDANGDGTTNISDSLLVLDHLFIGEREMSYLDTADANDDGEVNISDPISILSFLFPGEREIATPLSRLRHGPHRGRAWLRGVPGLLMGPALGAILPVRSRWGALACGSAGLSRGPPPVHPHMWEKGEVVDPPGGG